MTATVTVTAVGEPGATTEPAGSVGETGATLHGTVNPRGTATTYLFKWGTSESYGHETSMKAAGEGTTGVPVSEMLSGLAPGTTYHFRLVAKNAKGTAEGADQAFTTSSPPPPPGPPTATTEQGIAMGETAATVNGTLNPNGYTTKYFFNYGKTAAYGETTAPGSAGEDHLAHAVSATLVNLAPGATYHFQLVAENIAGRVAGVDQTVTTLSPSPPFSPPPTASSPPATPSPPNATITPVAPVAPVAQPPGLLFAGGSAGVKLTAPRRGFALRGSVDVGPAAAGGKLEVALFTASAPRATNKRRARVLVGRFSRSALRAGRVSFVVQLTAAGRSALRRHKRLAVSVRIVVAPAHGAAAAITREVVLHG
jgi:hypothetical protein